MRISAPQPIVKATDAEHHGLTYTWPVALWMPASTIWMAAALWQSLLIIPVTSESR